VEQSFEFTWGIEGGFRLKLNELASLLTKKTCLGDMQTEITGIESDSRHDYVDKAKQLGAVALVVSKPVETDLPYILVPDTRFAMAVCADHFFAHPSQAMHVIGITGTNGKTTTAHLIDAILSDASKKVDVMGTIGMRIGDQLFESKNTTQEALELHRNLRKMKDGGAQYAVMEVSSHALSLGRVKGVQFKTAIFTNLTQDHLDFHGTMENYMEAKGLFFSRLGNTYNPATKVHAILNADDHASQTYLAQTAVEVITYGIENDADVRAIDLRMNANGTQFTVKSYAGDWDFQLKMIGKFNVYNALAAIAAALVEGISLKQIAASLAEVNGVNGRFEPVIAGQSFLVVVDYAHTPDSLENVLHTIREFATGKIITVFGCGGDRDKSKRPIMGKIASELSDYVVLTTDNPRTENPATILSEIENGLHTKMVQENRYERIENRQTAIEKAIEMAGPHDVVLIAGKGHETYQEIHGVRTDFDDRKVAEQAIRGK
jgi:UDP-N-acetylmuramoyl-L-alanyl-D-glutamate--2,6-diaminopimelate ligase